MRWLPPKRLGVVCTVLAVGAASVVGCSSDGNGNGGAAGQAASAGHSNVGGATGGSGSGAGGVAVAGSGGGSPGGSGGSAGLSGSAGAGGQGGNATLASCAVSAIDADQPKLLSETGCIDMTDPAKPAPGLVPYAVNSPLWSDGAAKERFVAIPEGEKIHVLDCALEPAKCVDTGLGGSGGDDGHWQMPIGTVLVKNFSVKGQRIETRLFMRRSETAWKGFSYEWNETETEAALLADEKDRQLDGQVWHYPSRGQCLECHTKAGGRSLGPTTAQMNADYAYADGSMNQLAKFQALGLFDATPKTMPAYPDPYGAAGTLEQRARSYLQTNCAICHRPGGEFGAVDMRFTTDFADMKLCNEPSERDTGLVPEFRLVPTKPDESALSFRMHANFASNVRMPKIGSNVVDTPGAALIDAWITGITACPPPQ